MDLSTPPLSLLPLSPEWTGQAVPLYEQAFPLAERRPTDVWTQMLGGHRYFSGHAIAEGGDFCGLLTAWHFETFVYVEHFAILPEKRNGQKGARALAQFVALQSPLPIVLEVEEPTEEMARRRIGFYERGGFSLLTPPYLQPPYRAGEAFLPLRLMCTDAGFGEKHFHEIRDTLYREVYGHQ